MTSFEYFWNCSRFFDHSMQMSGKIPVSAVCCDRFSPSVNVKSVADEKN